MDNSIAQIDSIYGDIRSIITQARKQAYSAVNVAMVHAYWNIGRVIVENDQQGSERAEYGKQLITELADKLVKEFGDGFRYRNLWYMRSFYQAFPILHAVRAELSWTHYRRLLHVENIDARNFYMIEAVENRWSTRELDRQINSLLYERLALSQDKDKVSSLAQNGQLIAEPRDIIKDPYVLEFLELKESKTYLEKDLEKALIDKLQEFLLELGKGFSFVSRQQRITIDGDHFYIDLVFYNFILKCFVLIDLKVGKLTHQDIGQIDFYVRYFEKEFKQDDDNSTIGLILCAEKNEAMAKYTLLDESQSIFASKYKLYLPTEEELKREIERETSILSAEMSSDIDAGVE
jgi:predicted nuclease of restriction endonuclease-like (RecB) superfamily